MLIFLMPCEVSFSCCSLRKLLPKQKQLTPMSMHGLTLSITKTMQPNKVVGQTLTVEKYLGLVALIIYMNVVKFPCLADCSQPHVFLHTERRNCFRLYHQKLQRDDMKFNQLLLIQPTTNAKWSLNRRDNNSSNDTERCWWYTILLMVRQIRW